MDERNEEGTTELYPRGKSLETLGSKRENRMERRESLLEIISGEFFVSEDEHPETLSVEYGKSSQSSIHSIDTIISEISHIILEKIVLMSTKFYRNTFPYITVLWIIFGIRKIEN